MLVGLLANLLIRPAARSEAVRPFAVSRNLAFDFILIPEYLAAPMPPPQHSKQRQPVIGLIFQKSLLIR